MHGIGVAVLTEVLANIVAKPEILCVGGVDLHPTPRAPVTLSRQLNLKIPANRQTDRQTDRQTHFWWSASELTC